MQPLIFDNKVNNQKQYLNKHLHKTIILIENNRISPRQKQCSYQTRTKESILRSSYAPITKTVLRSVRFSATT